METPIWIGYRENGPKRRDFAAVNIGDDIYVIGGIDPSFRYGYFRPIMLFKMNIKTLDWEKVDYPVESDDHLASSPIKYERDYEQAFGTDVPYDRFGHSAVAYRDLIFVWGGANHYRPLRHHELSWGFQFVYAFDPATQMWHRRKTRGTIPLPRDGQATCLRDNHMFMFGGVIHEASQISAQRLYHLNLDTMVWNVIELVLQQGHAECWPMPRASATLCTFYGKYYLFGGKFIDDLEDEMGMEFLEDIIILDPGARRWSAVPLIHAPVKSRIARQSHSAFTYNGKMYIFGGMNPLNGEVFNDLWEFEPETLEFKPVKIWSSGSVRESPPRLGHKSLVIGHRAYVFGGLESDSRLKWDDLRMRWNTTTQKGDDWPFLSCYSVLDLRPSLRTMCIAKLNQMGFPVHDERAAQFLPHDVYLEMKSLADESTDSPWRDSMMKKYWFKLLRKRSKKSTRGASVRRFLGNIF